MADKKLIDIDRLSKYHENINTLLTTKQESLVSGDNIKTINGESILGSGDLETCMVSITYSELKSLRDNSQLIPGMQYRITDYITTTIQEDTQSAGHQFDVIVTADDESALNEIARACLHEGDTYFSENGANLEAWQIWYCLDNNVNRFAWADEENGKGVIYRMIDEWNNECPYDFKNIMFRRYQLNAPEALGEGGRIDKMAEIIQSKFDANALPYIWGGMASGEDRCWESAGDLYSTQTGEYKEFYTFSNIIDDVITDKSITNNYCYSNVIKEYISNNKIVLNNIVFFNTSNTSSCSSNSFGNNCYDNSFGNNCYNNSFGNGCFGNSFRDYCHDNSFGNYCSENSFGNSCYCNSFENNCSYNLFDENCYKNSFENYCSENSFGGGCYNNSFGNSCYKNSFENNCYSNSFGNNCYDNSFGDACCSNLFGDDCSRNLFGEDFSSNSFENNCYDNSFGDGCHDNSFGNGCYDNSFGNSCYDNLFGNGCNNNSFGDACDSNSFGNNCYSNSFENYCNSNSFGNDCSSNSFGSSCSSNSFGSNCYSNSFKGGYISNSFGNYCHHNSFGYYCHRNSFGNQCDHNSFGKICRYNSFGNECRDNELLTSYTFYCHFDDGCRYINLTTSQTTSSGMMLRNVNVNRGVCGTSRFTINIENLNSEKEINVDNVNGYIYILEGSENIYKTTYSNLVSLRDNSQLIPGLQYRITDYITTTAQADTQSAGHQFDVIVTALDEQTLSEDAKAIHNADNDYFNDCNLSAWELKYCLDNDINRFAWSTYISVINSSDIGIKSELVNDNNEFNTPFRPTAYMYVDTSQSYDDDLSNKGNDYIYEYGHETNPDGVDDQLCLFKSDIEIYQEDGTDYSDKFFYAGTHDVDGVTYDKWRKAEIDYDGNLVWAQSFNGPDSGIYILTEQIITGSVVEEKVPGGDGKGVIYYMKDEHDNECSYDFKNIQFKRYKITSFTNPDIVNSDTMPLLYAQKSSHGYGYEVDMDDYIYCYTFASNQTDDNEDLSVTQLCDCKLNKIEKHELDNSIKISLNNNVFFYHELPEYSLTMEIRNNYFMHGSHHNTFIGSFYGNNIQNYFRYNIDCGYCDNVVSNYVESNLTCAAFTANTLEESFNHNIIGTKCVGNKFGVTTKGNIIGSDCQANEFGMVFQDNVISIGFCRNNFANTTGGNNFGSNFKYNNCAPYFIENTFVDNTMNNTFGCSFRTNKFGSRVGINSFGEQCRNNTFGSNIVGNTCHSNTRNNIIGSNFTHNIGKFAYSTFGNNVHDDVENGAFITACDFGNSSYFNLQAPSSASTENYVKNLKFCNVNGTASEYVNITAPITNQDYELKIAKNSNGELKIYCEADLIA